MCGNVSDPVTRAHIQNVANSWENAKLRNKKLFRAIYVNESGDNDIKNNDLFDQIIGDIVARFPHM